MNRVYLDGFIAKAPKEEFTQGGVGVTKFTLVTKEPFKDKVFDSYHNIVAWGDLGQELKMRPVGARCFIEGKLKTRSWEKDGQKHYMTEVIASNIFASQLENPQTAKLAEAAAPRKILPKTIPVATVPLIAEPHPFTEDDLPF